MSLFQKLLIVAGVAGTVLVASILVLMNNRQTRDAIRVADMTVMQNILEIGYHDTAGYPLLAEAKAQYGILGEGNLSTLCLSAQGKEELKRSPSSCTGRVLLSLLPRDPSFVGSAAGLPCSNDPDNACEYTYSVAGDGSNYQIIFRLEGATGSLQCNDYPCLKTLTKEGVR